MTVANATASAHDNAMPAAAWTDEWAHARRCACIGCGSGRARGVARPPSSSMRRGRFSRMSCAESGRRPLHAHRPAKFRGLVGAHRAASPLSGAFRPIAALLASFFRASRSFLARFFRASRALPSRRCSPVSRSVQPRFVAVRVRFVAVPAPVVAEPVKCAPSSRGTAAARLPGRCREDADRAPRLYRRSYPRYYNPPIAEQ